MRATILPLFIFIFALFACGLPALGSHESSGRRAVPLSELWEYYAGLNPLSFTVRECGFDEYKGGYETGDLARAANRAAQAWEQAVSGLRISIQVSDCSLRPSFRNGEHEIYWDSYPSGGAELGDYMGFFLFEGDLVEHDIAADSAALAEFVERDDGDRQIALYNLIVHELGHALGLGDAYLVDTRSCDWSVMLLQCTGPRRQPTAQDVAAVRHIHGFAAETSVSPPALPVPSPPPAKSKPPFKLSSYDFNENGVIDDSELFLAVDRWAKGKLNDQQLQRLIDAWIAQVRVASVKRRTTAPVQTAIEIYDTSGERIASLGCSFGDPRSRTQSALERENAPRGVYITSIRDCQTNQHKVISGLFQG